MTIRVQLSEADLKRINEKWRICGFKSRDEFIVAAAMLYDHADEQRYIDRLFQLGRSLDQMEGE